MWALAEDDWYFDLFKAFNSTTFANDFPKWPALSHMHVTCSALPSNVNTVDLREIWDILDRKGNENSNIEYSKLEEI